MSAIRLLVALVALLGTVPATAEDGYDLWLRYRPVAAEARAGVLPRAEIVLREGRDPTIDAAARELHVGLREMLGRPVPIREAGGGGAIVIGTPATSPTIAALRLPLGEIGDEGYLIRTVAIAGRPATIIAANASVGVLYGAFHYLRLVQTGQAVDRLAISERPRLQLRLLNHWDNLDRSVERGYAGHSIWDWQKLPGFADPRYTDYARANASIGINGTVLNNVNSNADILTAPHLLKVKRLADLFRPWGIRVYLSARFSAPREIGGLPTADPLDPTVRAWWRAKADEIYRLVPDFGGFLVKANSEGQPGPQDYRRTHADGANMLAEAVAPHGGVVMWRAFVYAADNDEDRVRQAYSEFQPLDGRFADNVIVQVKNGPLDFQPREPFHPLFGAMPHTSIMAELQITKEYLGFATHLAYLGTMWEEFLRADTHVGGAGSTVARVLDGSLQRQRITGMAGVANIGSDRTWSGSQFDQANWYAFGRLAWNPTLGAEPIANEWARLTWGGDDATVGTITAMMMRSRQAVVDYMTPLGLTHLMATGHHYGPGPWVDDLERADWNPVYFHRADRDGIGFDRTASGSDAVAQYARPVGAAFADRDRIAEDDLLWFHRVSWDSRMRSGRTLWDELVTRYDRGVKAVGGLRRDWAGLAGRVDPERFSEVAQFLAIQEEEARWWRNASIAYFASISRRPLPAGHAAPPEPLSFYQAIRTPYAPGN